MTKLLTTNVRFASLALALVVCAGCSSNTATKDDIARLESQIGDVRRTAEESLNTANEARQMAQEGDARTRRMEEAVNRSFQKSMYK